jgi:hypothetical protein
MATPIPGTLKNVTINNVVATNASLTCTVTGIPGHNVEGVTLSNIRISYKGGNPYRPADEPVPEFIDRYPDPGMFGALPAYGFYCRHVNGLTLSNVQLSFDEGYWRLTPEEGRKIQWVTDDGVPRPSEPGRPGYALVCDDVSDLDIEALRARPSTVGDPLMRFVNVRDAILRACMPPDRTTVFLEAVGPHTSGIRLVGNDLSRAEKALALGDEMKPDAVMQLGSTGSNTSI